MVRGKVFYADGTLMRVLFSYFTIVIKTTAKKKKQTITKNVKFTTH